MAAKARTEQKNTKKKMKVFVAVPSPGHGPVALEVSSHDTVASIKATLHETEGIPASRQRLVFACSALPDDDDTTLADHGVADSATIQLVDELAVAAEAEEEEKIPKKVKVFVVVPRPGRAPIELEVSRDDTVASIKARLHDMEGIPPWQQRLVFACSALPDDDDTTLADHGVADSATIELVETRMNVFVRMERTLHFSNVERCDTVESFRLRIQERVGIRPAQQRLIYDRSQLEDDHTLADYGVQNCSTLHFMIRLDPMRTRMIELDVEVTGTVNRIKERVEEAEGIPVACQIVYYCGQELDDSRALADYDDMEWVHIKCERHESGGTNTTTKGAEKETVKRHDNAEVTRQGENVEKRRYRVYLIGPERAEICPSSCDNDPAY